MNEQELRQLVRDAIARHGNVGPVPAQGALRPASVQGHASHAMFVVSDGADSGGPCVIEPAVQCNHCGYCKSYGH